MNWLVYIGGGWIFLVGITRYIFKMEPTAEGLPALLFVIFMTITAILSTTSVWIWICWRFIR